MKKVAVIGVGLIGGSLLKALKAFDFYLIAVTRSQSTVDKIIKSKLADEASTDIAVVKDADIVFVCTPMNAIIETLRQLDSVVSPNCIVTDAGSLKSFVLDFVENSNLNYKFIAGHPMAGTENKGVDNAVDGLFDAAKWVLIPSSSSNQTDFDFLKNIIASIGSIVIETNAQSHDQAVALISHAPMLLSQVLFASVDSSDVSRLAFTLASSGFRDMTRLAMTNSEMAEDMFKNNYENINEAIANVFDCFKKINSDNYKEIIEELAIKRKKMYSDGGKNVFDEVDNV